MMKVILPTYATWSKGMTPLEVNFKSELDEDVDMSYDDLASFVNNFLKNMICLERTIKD